MPGTSLGRDEVEITLVGAGRSGAQIALVAVMLGFPLGIYDFDRLEPENQGRQLHTAAEIAARREKVVALRALLRAFVPDARVATHCDRFEGRADQPRSPVVVLAVDSMRERRHVWDALADAPDVLLVLDVRIGAAQVRLHEVQRGRQGDLEEYARSLHDDPVDSAPAPCAQDSTAHAAAAAAALVGGALCAFVDGTPRPRWSVIDLDRAHFCAGWPLEESNRGAPVTFERRPET